MAYYSPCKGISCPGCCHHMNPFWSKLIKNDEAAGMETVHCVLCLSSGGQEKHAVTGTMLFLPTDTEYVMKSECERKKMADEEWEEMKQEACVSPLGPPPSCYIHSLFFTMEEMCACACTTSYPHKRFCILCALFILPFIWTVLFSANHLMSCLGLSCVGKKSTQT